MEGKHQRYITPQAGDAKVKREPKGGNLEKPKQKNRGNRGSTKCPDKS